MKTSALIVLALTLATSILARPPIIDSEEYVDNNVIEKDSIPAFEQSEEDERAEYVEM